MSLVNLAFEGRLIAGLGRSLSPFVCTTACTATWTQLLQSTYLSVNTSSLVDQQKRLNPVNDEM